MALALLAVACGPQNQQNSLRPAGPGAQQIQNLFTPVVWIAIAVFVLVEGGILLFVVRYRHRKGKERMPAQVHGNTRLEIGWTIVPALILVVIAVPTVSTIFDLAAKPSDPNTINVTVKCHQWWWEFDYTDPAFSPGGKEPLVTADELVIPTDRPVYIQLQATGGLIGGDNPDYQVIHSFWVPELNGKTDCIPDRTNHLTIQASDPGMYRGQCMEFCGLSHANMRFRVIAKTPTDFDAWMTAQKADATQPAAGTLAAQGASLFKGQLSGDRGSCIACHGVQGVTYQAGQPANEAAPNLTHFASRDCFAGCIFDNHDEAQLRAWLHDPGAVKPGSKMPNYHLSSQEIDALVAYLESLN